MAENRQAFEEAMQTGARAAWDQNWEQAVAAYQRAVEEVPTDVSALSGLGLALFETGETQQALETYRQASKLKPDDPAILEHIGEICEQSGQVEEASAAFMAAAELYRKQNITNLALERWEDAARACPDCEQPHVKLLQYHQQHGQALDAVNECLVLAGIYQKKEQIDYAIKVCEYALQLAPHKPEVQTVLESLRYNKEFGQTEPTLAQQAQATGVALEANAFDFDVSTQGEPAEERGSPADLTRQKALTDLAETFFEDEVITEAAIAPRRSKAEIDALIGRAIDFQTRGKIEEAIRAYEEVIEAGVERPAVHFNLGLLYQEKLRFDAAISQFQRTAHNADYRLGSHFSMGECFRAKGRIDEALEHFIEVLKIVDLATVQREHADDLIQLYEHLADGYVAKGDREQALEFTNSLVTFLNEQGWGDKVVQARRRLDALTEEGPILSLAEMLSTSGSSQLLESVALAQEYTKRNMFYAALEECYYAIGHAPTYMPIHRQIAQVLLAMDKIEEAAAKLVVIADTYLTHGNIRQTVAMYERALKLAPMNIATRTKLIDMLISFGQIDEALTHYLNLADTYYQMAQIEQARDTYQEALKLAPRGTAENQWEVRILHKVGDIDMQRIDWRHATEVYSQIRKLAPDDERARLTLMELHYRLNRPELAIAELDDLLKIYKERKQTKRMFTVLEDAVNDREDSIPLRARLAQAYLDSGNVEKALQHLDKLGDLQMEAQQMDDAKATIQAIIMLRPPNVEAYQQLLNQLEGGS